MILLASVHRYYESRRRLFKDQQPDRVEQVQKTKLNGRKRLLRRKVAGEPYNNASLSIMVTSIYILHMYTHIYYVGNKFR